MQPNIDRRGIDSILDGFAIFADSAKFYSVWQGNNLKFQFVSGDILTDGLQLLENNLQAMKQSGTDAIFSLRFYSKTEKDNFVNNKTPYISSFNFKVTEENLGMIGNAGNAVANQYSFENRLFEKLNEMAAKQTELESRLNAIDEDEEEETEQPKGIAGLLENFLNTPQGMGLATAVINGIVGKIMPTQTSAPRQNIGLAGIETEETRLQKALEKLAEHDEDLVSDLEKLADMAENNGFMFKQMLGMLRKM